MELIGTTDGRTFSVQPFIDGIRGSDATDHADLWSQLGAYCARISRIQPNDQAPASLFSRFGRDLPTAWAAHLSYNLAKLDAQDELLRLGALTRDEQHLLRARLCDLLAASPGFGLCHGDLAPRNLLLPVGAAPVLIDWGSATFGPAPWTDLLNIDRNRRQKNSVGWRFALDFAEASGVDLTDQWEVFTSYRLLQHVDLVRWSLDRRPDRTPDTVAALRALLNDHSQP